MAVIACLLRIRTDYGPSLGAIMERRTLRLAAGAMAAGVAVLAVGCSASGASGPGKRPGPAASQILPVPFTVMARYTATMLGLDHPDALAGGPGGNLYLTDLSHP